MFDEPLTFGLDEQWTIACRLVDPDGAPLAATTAATLEISVIGGAQVFEAEALSVTAVEDDAGDYTEALFVILPAQRVVEGEPVFRRRVYEYALYATPSGGARIDQNRGHLTVF